MLDSTYTNISLLQADVIERLRLQYKKDLLKVVDVVLSHQVLKVKHAWFSCLSHVSFNFLLKLYCNCIVLMCFQGVKNKNKLILRLMEQLVYPNPAAYREKLIRFSSLNHTNYSQVVHCTDL